MTTLEICNALKAVGVPQEPMGLYLFEYDEYDNSTGIKYKVDTYDAPSRIEELYDGDPERHIAHEKHKYGDDWRYLGYQPTLEELLAWCRERGWRVLLSDVCHRPSVTSQIYDDEGYEVAVECGSTWFEALALAILKAKGVESVD